MKDDVAEEIYKGKRQPRHEKGIILEEKHGKEETYIPEGCQSVSERREEGVVCVFGRLAKSILKGWPELCGDLWKEGHSEEQGGIGL